MGNNGSGSDIQEEANMASSCDVSRGRRQHMLGSVTQTDEEKEAHEMCWRLKKDKKIRSRHETNNDARQCAQCQPETSSALKFRATGCLQTESSFFVCSTVTAA